MFLSRKFLNGMCEKIENLEISVAKLEYIPTFKKGDIVEAYGNIYKVVGVKVEGNSMNDSFIRICERLTLIDEFEEVVYMIYYKDELLRIEHSKKKFKYKEVVK